MNALFVTLTYPSLDSKAAANKTHLDSLLKRVRRKFPSAGALWKLEYTAAGTPHFHLVIFGVNFWFHREVAQAWAEIVNSDNPEHVRAGTRVERLVSPKSTARYITKYVSKTSSYPANHKGRVWGKSGNFSSLLSQKLSYIMTLDQAVKIRRILDLVRFSLNRRRKFRRRQTLHHRQRWFLAGDSVQRIAERFGLFHVKFEPT